MRFDSEGHIEIAPSEFLDLARQDPTGLVDHVLLAGTPRVFATYSAYRAFLRDVCERLGLHPRAVAVCGSAHLGFSYTPRKEKVWLACRPDSDVDLVIVDADYYDGRDAEVRRWEERQSPAGPHSHDFKSHLRRQTLRRFFCHDDQSFPRSTCVPHRDALSRIDTMRHGLGARTVSAFIFRDWWSLRVRREHDLRELDEGIHRGKLPAPP